MFHPSVYDNLKVVLEGAVYDADFEEKILISGRSDLMDMATAVRQYKVSFKLRESSEEIIGHVSISSSLEALYQEKIKDRPENAGCLLEYSIALPVEDIDIECADIQKVLQNRYGHSADVQQHLSYQFGKPRGKYNNLVTIRYRQEVGEDEIPFLENSLPLFFEALEEICKMKEQC
ncbi:hypothetical protein ACFFJY_09825 [Fictibacillus aquaticus]|uniref:Uncharacterized protein n=1 Tax=Fictibacillus aquaticus TaxID=2021314 RepID=A0A235FBK9_9BACL|nr:hypothetical protein [Fictibacillus aquaticus]OYD58569.1 hypothetical protein CGZ90_01305 [Fictibacillus aquaticus]